MSPPARIRAPRAPTKGADRGRGGVEDTRGADEGWQPRVHDAGELAALVDRLPVAPGVYVMRDRSGRRIYVGKARNLRSRVRQYFSGQDTRYFVPRLAKLIGDIETVVTDNEKEALLLENHLIKQHQPRFNVQLRDDKQYLVLRLDTRAKWPRLEVVRHVAHDGAQYHGPYHSASSARQTLRVVNRHFKLRTCSDWALEHRTRACLQYEIGRCPAPCVLEVDAAAYAEQVRDVDLFLAGRQGELVGKLATRMREAAEALDYEAAAQLRDQLAAIRTTLESQRVVGSADVDQDLVGMWREGGQVEFALLQVRGGRLLGTRTFSQHGMELPDPEVLHSFLVAYYDGTRGVPPTLLLPHALADDDAAPLTAWLTERRGEAVRVIVPGRGPRRRLLELAQENAKASFETRRNRRDDREAALAVLREALSLSRTPRRIECYDVSHLQGSDAVASMVVFQDGEADKASYRSFKIKGLHGAGLTQGDRQNDDFASLQEALTRRFRRALAGGDGPAEGWAMPDLIVIDGGKGQLGRVVAVMQDLGIPAGAEGVDIIALAKERDLGVRTPELARLRSFAATHLPLAAADTARAPGDALAAYVIATNADASEGAEAPERAPDRVFLPGRRDALRLRPGSSELFLLARIRDEAHRFAIGHHRKRRGKRQLTSALDEIPGVGPAIRRALLDRFGKLAAVRTATLEELEQVKGVGPALAVRIREGLR